jgi:hypothetical protein
MSNIESNISLIKKTVKTAVGKIKDTGVKYTDSVENFNLVNTVYSNPWYFGFVELLQYCIFIYIIYKYNPFDVPTDHPAFTNLLVLFVSFLYVVLFYFLKVSTPLSLLTDPDINKRKPTEVEFLYKTIKTVGVFIGFVFVTLGVIWLFKHLSILTTLLRHGLLFTIVLITISIIYILCKPLISNILNKAKTQPISLLSFALNLVIFIPCLLEQFMYYLKNQYNLTSKPVWMLLGVEFILIILWVIIPIVFHMITTHDGKQLLSEPKYLNMEHTLGNFENLHVETIKKHGRFKYHYSLSAWIYINPQPPNTSSAYTKYTSLLNYGNKPNVQYNGKLNSFRVMAQVGKENQGDLVEIFETKDIIYQKWNNIVINYDGGTMDVFLNGELVGSRPNIVPYMTYENITCGTKDGIQGGICNVTYFNSVMKKSTILLMYKLLRDKKVPL